MSSPERLANSPPRLSGCSTFSVAFDDYSEITTDVELESNRRRESMSRIQLRDLNLRKTECLRVRT